MATRRALILSFLDRYAGLLINIGTSMVLARLLSPAEIGIFSVTMVLVGVLSGLRDMGATTYLIQEKELTDDRIRATWTVQLSIGVTLAVFVAAMALPVAQIYSEPDMAFILWILSANLAINPFGSITVAWWMREMQFHWIALMRFAGAITGSGVSIFLAWKNVGAMSLAWASLATTIAGILVALVVRPKQLPTLPGFREIKRVFSFGSRLSGITILGSLSSGAPEAFLGRLQNMSQTGLYSRANGLVSMFDRLIMDAINSVTLPLFSQKVRDGENLGDIYIRAISLITGLGWPFLACLAIASFPIMRILYGNQWDEAVPLTQILCLSFAIALPMSLSQSVMISNGMVGVAFRITIILAALKITTSLIGATLSLNTLGWMLCIYSLIATLIWIRITIRILDIPWRMLMAQLFRSLALAMITAIPFVLASVALGFKSGAGAWAQLAVAMFFGSLFFIAAVYMLKHPMHVELNRIIRRQ